MLFISDLEVFEEIRENQTVTGGYLTPPPLTPVFLGATSGTGLSANFAPTQAITQVTATSTSDLSGIGGQILVRFGTQVNFLSTPTTPI